MSTYPWILKDTYTELGQAFIWRQTTLWSISLSHGLLYTCWLPQGGLKTGKTMHVLTDSLIQGTQQSKPSNLKQKHHWDRSDGQQVGQCSWDRSNELGSEKLEQWGYRRAWPLPTRVLGGARWLLGDCRMVLTWTPISLGLHHQTFFSLQLEYKLWFEGLISCKKGEKSKSFQFWPSLTCGFFVFFPSWIIFSFLGGFFLLLIHVFGIISKKSLPNPRSWKFSPVFPSTSFTLLHFTLGPSSTSS